MDEIPHLSGQVCEALIAQEYWYQGELSSAINVLFLKIKGGSWYRLFFDCGVLFWQEVDAPDVWTTTLDDEYHYPQQEIGHNYKLNGAIIQHIEAVNTDNWPELYISFVNGSCLVLRDFCDYQLVEFRS